MNTTIQVKADLKTKVAAKKILKKQGVTMSLAFNEYLKEVVKARSYQIWTQVGTATDNFPDTLMNEEIPKIDIPKNWKEERDWQIKYGKRYTSVKEMMDDVVNWKD